MPFKKGNQEFKKRVSKKNLLPLIRERVLKALDKRLVIDKELRTVNTVDLLKFAQSIMPKDLSIRVTPDIQYISNTPRPDNLIELEKIETNNSNNSIDNSINTKEEIQIQREEKNNSNTMNTNMSNDIQYSDIYIYNTDETEEEQDTQDLDSSPMNETADNNINSLETETEK